MGSALLLTAGGVANVEKQELTTEEKHEKKKKIRNRFKKYKKLLDLIECSLLIFGFILFWGSSDFSSGLYFVLNRKIEKHIPGNILLNSNLSEMNP